MTNMETLYIIGNGFDRYHGLKTSYQNFGFFLQENYSNLYDNLVEYYGLPEIDPDDDDSYNDPLWADFENALAELDFETILDENSGYLPDYASDEFRDRDYHAYQQVMERIVENLTCSLCKAFADFILNVEFPESSKVLLLKLDRNSMFFNFNYTSTLEHYYRINKSQIIYIHNKAESIDDTIILGHGVKPDNFKTEEIQEPEGLTDEQLSEWRQDMSDSYDYAYETGKEELISYFEKSFKPTNEIIEQNQQFFMKLSGIRDVYVLGHSLSEVDIPYFEKIKDSVNGDAIWHVSNYYPEEKLSHSETLLKLGIKQENIQMIQLKDLQVPSSQLKLSFDS